MKRAEVKKRRATNEIKKEVLKCCIDMTSIGPARIVPTTCHCKLPTTPVIACPPSRRCPHI